MMTAPGAPTKDELAALERRLAAVEAALVARTPPVRMKRCGACLQMVADAAFCQACGTRLLHAPAPAAAPAPAHALAPTPASASTPTSSPATPQAPPGLAPARPPTPRAPPSTPVPTPAPRAELTMERVLGQRFAPRLGAGLVFLGILFFLGVAIQRGWIGPLAQLALAAIAGVALLTTGAILTARRGYGTYPQVLEGTGACVLYLVAFVSYALPYYQRETNLTELGSGILMVLVAVGTIALAFHRDSRVIAGLGFGLAFLTAPLGRDALPEITLAYVAVLGMALAFVVARKRWVYEGALGTLATGALLLMLAERGASTGAPDPALTALLALGPAAAFLWLSVRPLDDSEEADGAAPAVAFLTFAWATIVSLGLFDNASGRGMLALAWAVVAGGHAAIAARVGGHRNVVGASSIAGVILWLAGAPFAWSSWNEAALLTTATYAAGGLALALIATAKRGAPIYYGALVLAAAAAVHAVFFQTLLQPPWESGEVGPWQAWITLGLVLTPLAVVATSRAAQETTRMAAFWTIAAFGTLWTFALFGTPILVTTWLLLVAAGLLALALIAHDKPTPVGQSAFAAAVVVIALAAAKGATLDTYSDARLDALPAGIQAVALSAALLAVLAIARARELLPPASTPTAATTLVAGSAIILANYVLSYAEGAATSILLGLLGVAYLAGGFVGRRDTVYRYTGFALFGFVLLRVFTVDLRDTDLAVRALVFAVLGALLLGIGYAYARANRKETATKVPEP